MSQDSRTCPKCGHVYPLAYTKPKCKFCRTEFDTIICYECKKLLPKSMFTRRKSGTMKGYLNTRCTPCDKARKRKWSKDNPELELESARRFRRYRTEAANKAYDEFVAAVDKATFKPMTEEEWLDTCRYFGGCAICGNEHIEARQFFMPFQTGGKYAVWNMFPMCGACAKHAIKMTNPFRWLDKYLGKAESYGLNEQRRERLIAYLKLKIEEASK